MSDEHWYATRALIPFETPTRITVVAASNGGKTVFVNWRMLKECLQTNLKISIIIMAAPTNPFSTKCLNVFLI